MKKLKYKGSTLKQETKCNPFFVWGMKNYNLVPIAFSFSFLVPIIFGFPVSMLNFIGFTF